jgi:plastocyanin
MTLITSSRRALYLLLTLGLVSLLALAIACSGDDDDDGGDDDGGEPTPAETDDGNGDDDGGSETFDISMTDNAFDPTELTVPAGATVTVNLTNDGAAIHNMRIAGADNEFDNDDDAVSDPDIVNGGDPATIDWTAPDTAGEIDFRCDFHPTDMVGTITVE